MKKLNNNLKNQNNFEKPSWWRRIFSAKFVFLASLITLIFISVAFSKELYRKYMVRQEIEKVKGEVEELERRNKELTYLIDYLETDSFKELQARQSLGLVHQGETAVAVESGTGESGEANPEVASEQNAAEGITLEVVDSNPKKWWRYFFAADEGVTLNINEESHE